MDSCDFCEWNETETIALQQQVNELVDRIEAMEVEVMALKIEAAWTPIPVALDERTWV